VPIIEVIFFLLVLFNVVHNTTHETEKENHTIGGCKLFFYNFHSEKTEKEEAPGG
jgi:hypothetical protein